MTTVGAVTDIGEALMNKNEVVNWERFCVMINAILWRFRC